ncbi:hypothetical protein [Hoylesella timonensis]|uniref:hypothetical protein n=1 Tax=Hoylesella timonensis TaxID=386414 RepID=UPI00242C4E58|nr:hypothetical protein [Hoylesella timonensis]
MKEPCPSVPFRCYHIFICCPLHRSITDIVHAVPFEMLRSEIVRPAGAIAHSPGQAPWVRGCVGVRPARAKANVTK